MEPRYGAVVAALLLVRLATGLPAGPTSPPPPAAGGRSAHDWGSWPPPYEDEDDDEDGFLGPRALPLEGRPPEGADDAEDLVPQDSDVDSEILAEYVREVAASRAATGHTSVPDNESAPGDQPASKALTTREVSNNTHVDAVSSSQLNTSGSSDSVTTGARESKSFSSSVAPASVPLVKPLKADTGHNAVDAEGKAATTRERLVTSLPVVPASESTTAAGAPRESESGEKRAEPQDSDATAEAAPQGGSNASQAGAVAPSAEGSSPQPADVYATAPAEAASETEAGPDVSSSSPPEEETGWTAYDASAAAAADDDVDVVGQQEEAVPQPDLRSRTAEREAAEEDVPADADVDAPVSRGRVAPAAPPPAAMDAASITGIALGIVVFSSLIGAVSFVMYRRRYLNKPQTLNDKCSNPDSSGYIDDSTLRENSEEMYSLDNDSFLNSLEAMTIQNYWTDNVKHTKL